MVAALVSDLFDWRAAYAGGGLGTALLLLRIGVYESGMFEQVKAPRRSGVLGSGAAVGAVTLAVAFASVAALEETFAKDLDFLDE